MFQYWFHSSKEQLFGELGDSLYQTVHLVKRGKSSRLVFTTCTAPTASLEEQEAVILVYLYAPKLRGMLEADGIWTMLWQEGDYLSYGEEQKDLEDWEETWESYRENNAPTGTEQVLQVYNNQNNGSYMLELPMQRYHLSIFQVIPKEQYLSDIKRVLWLLAGYVLICLVAGIGLAFYFLKRNYAPVKELLSLTRKMNRRGEEGAEFVQIRKLVETLLERYFEGQQESMEQLSTQKSICFYRLLHGKNKYSSISEEDWQTIQEHVPGGQYLLYSINLEQVKGDWEHSESEMIPEEVRKLLYFVVENVAEELLSENWHFYGAAVLESYVFLLNGGDKKGYENLKNISRQIDRFLQQHYEVVMSFSISSVHTGREGIQVCWQEIVALNQYREKTGEPVSVLFYEEWEKEERKRQKVESEKKEAPQKSLAEQVAAYIEEHYTDKLLSGGMLADKFGLSQSNLTQKFKRKKDIGVMEYIDYVRLENAKKLLEEGYTVNETADKVGYYNTRPLIRIFRDIEGVTPAEYRSMIAGKGGRE